MPALTPAERSERARIAALRRWSKTDAVQGTAAARAAFLDRFDREVDPDGVLPPDERARRSARARKAHFRTLALKSAQVRRKKVG